MNKFAILFFILVVSLGSNNYVDAGLAAYGICQSGCNAVAAACYAAAGATFGAITFGLGTPAAVLACAAAQGTCMAACVAAGAAPTP